MEGRGANASVSGRMRRDPLTYAAIGAALLVIFPIAALAVMAFSGETGNLARAAQTVLPHAAGTTAGLLIGLALCTGLIGAMCAWLVSFFEFPGRRFFAWALMLPLAVPTYISAYAFVEFFTFTGPIQQIVRSVGGFELARDYWFPDIRSLPGAVLVLSLVLYPYVYLSMRALFVLQGRRAIEAAMLLGAGQRTILGSVLIPLARPALALGVVLALMEAINDVGAMQVLGVQTLTFSVFSLWVNQGDMAGSAQLALLLLGVVILLIWIERAARRGQQISEGSQSAADVPFQRLRLSPMRQAGAIVACALPLLLGFGVPFFTLGLYAWRYLPQGIDERLWGAIGTTITLAGLAALITVLVALVLGYAVRVNGTRMVRGLVRLASVGYAIPGTIIALGIFLPLARFDNLVDAFMRDWFGISTGLLITGSGATLVFAYAVRFMAVAEGSIDGSFRKLSPNLDLAAASYGYGRWATLQKILLPLMRPAIATAALLVFIDSVKELSATLLLRPFGIDTISIYVHELASRGRVEQAGLASLIIMAVSILPVIFVTRAAFKDQSV